MKKLILTAALFTSMGSFAFAQSNDSIPQAEQPFLIVEAIQDDYKEISLGDLNENVQAAIKAFEETDDVKKLEYDSTLKQTRVTLEDKVSKGEKVVILDDDGKEVK